MIQIDGNRLNAALQELATIGATPAGGVTRLTLSRRRQGGARAAGAHG